MEASINFIDLNVLDVTYLLVVGFIGGLVSGFVGSGGAFVLTPAMMSMGVPGIIAVASNICHKFPKALVGAIKRAKYGQVDWKLGLVLGVSAEAGVLYGASVQEHIKRSFGDAGSNLYVSVAFVVVLGIVGGYVLWDAWKVYRGGTSGSEHEKVSRLALWVQSIHIPGTMVYFKSLNAQVSILFTIPLGFATGMLAATIAVGGFIGVPGMHYLLGAPSLMASATELVTAFVMGVGGTIKFGWSGLVDIRLAMIILAGSLFGIQLGAIGTTYVKPHMIKVVMGTIMSLVLVSRAIVIPVYLAQLNLIQPLNPHLVSLLNNLSFVVLIAALAAGAAIVFAALWRGIGQHRRELAGTEGAFSSPVATPASPQLSPLGRYERFLVATDGSDYSAGAVREALRLAQRCGARVRVISVLSNTEYESMGDQLLKQEMDNARRHLDTIKVRAAEAGIACETDVIQGSHIHREIAREAESMQADLIIMGRRGRHGLARLMLGDVTARVIGQARCSVLVVPRNAEIEGRRFLIATDGSRFGDAAAVAAGNLARLCGVPLSVVSITQPSHSRERRAEADAAVNRTVAFLKKDNIAADGEVLHGRPDEIIVQSAQQKHADLIVMGSHGRTGLDRVLLGSVTERAINATQIAVLVVRAS